MKKNILLLSAMAFCLSVSNTFAYSTNPTLKYTNAGTFPLWTEESYYSSPIAEDIDNDGKVEIIFSNYTITVLDAETGTTKWKVNSGKDRTSPVEETGSNGHTWSSIELHDINGDGKKEIITGHGHGLISVLDCNGYFLPGWPQTPRDASVRSVEVADIDGDGKKEIIAGLGVSDTTSIYVYNFDGSLRPGWPQTMEGASSWTYGIFMDTIAVSDLNNDGIMEIIVPSDVSYISVFEPDGTPYMANESVFGKKTWGQISLFENYAAEIRNDNNGWGYPVTGTELREDLYKGEFGHAKAKVCDVDNNGTKEIVVTTVMCNRKYAPTYPPTEYMTLAILNSDRTRYKNESMGYNWEVLPMDLGKPLVQNDIMITSGVFQSPTISDIDGDGKNEILFNSYNGKVHCFSLEKKEPYAWPYSLTKRTSPKYEYASPVVCRDINFDGKQEIIFTSFFDSTQGYGNVRGYLYVLNCEGKLIHKIELPDSKEPGAHPNGAMAEPLVQDIDGDGAYEVIINTLHSGICVYDL